MISPTETMIIYLQADSIAGLSLSIATSKALVIVVASIPTHIKPKFLTTTLNSMERTNRFK